MTAIYTQPRRSPHIARILCAAFLLLPILVGNLNAQITPEDDSDLFFPPKLKVEVSIEDQWSSRLSGEVDQFGTMSDKITFNQYCRFESLQLLPMIFFDQARSTIPKRYETLNSSFEADKYSLEAEPSPTTFAQDKSAIRKYYHILNIIGARMISSPSSRIELEGGYSTELGENEALGNDRADVVKEYLVSVWRIESERITLLPSRLMCHPDDNLLKQEEARRVIIHTTDMALLRPIGYQSTSIESEVIGCSVAIDPKMSPDDVSGIRLVITTNDEVLSQTNIAVHHDSLVYTFFGLWRLPRFLPGIEGPIKMQAFISGHNGNVRASNIVSIPVTIKNEYIEGPGLNIYTYDEFILFFESSDSCLSSAQEQAIERQIARIAQEFTHPLHNNWTIAVYASGEASDNPNVDVGSIRLEQTYSSQCSGLFEELQTDPSFQAPLHIVPPLDMLHGDQSNFIEKYAATAKTWFGNYADRVNELKEKKRALRRYRRPIDEKTLLQIDTLYRNRAGLVAQYLRTKLDPAIADTVFVTFDIFGPPEIIFSPEERFYARWVRIDIQHHDPRRFDNR